MGPWSIETVEEALAVVQRLELVGVAARDVRESLLIQSSISDTVTGRGLYGARSSRESPDSQAA
jgi:DNA-directed RNA polymerase specialized sigma54-like protein